MNNFWHHYTTVIPKLLNGVSVTLEITFFAVMIGIVIGMFMALGKMSRHLWLKIPANIYIECLRGTPLFVQIFLFHYGVSAVIKEIIGAPFSFAVMTTAIVVCGLNSGAYVAEIFRAGIQSVDKGQMEAGRSLGLTHGQTMWSIIFPQGIKNCLPTYASEFIVLVKETAVVGYIGMTDLTKAYSTVQSRTMDAMPPLIIIAVVYFCITKVLSVIFAKMERRLRESDRR